MAETENGEQNYRQPAESHVALAARHAARKQWIRITIAALIVLILGTTAAAYRAATLFLADGRLVAHTHQVIRQLDRIQGTLTDAETGQRGYVITGRPEYLEPYLAARDQLERSVATVTGLIANPAQRARLAALTPVLQAKMAELDRTVNLRRTEGFDAAQAVVLSDEAKQLMDAVRARLAEMQSAASQLLQERQRQTASDLRRAKQLLVAVSLLGGALIVFATLMVERDMRQSEQRLNAESAERRRGEATLHDQAQQTRAIVDSIVDAIVTIDEYGIIRTANAVTERLFGYDVTELVGQNVNVLMPPPYRDEHDEYLAAYRATGQPKIIGIGREVTARRKNGSTFPVDLAVSEAMVDNQRFFTGVVRDLTDRKLAEAKVSELQRLVQERGRLADIGALTAQIVHDIGNPIAAVSMQVQRLRRTVVRTPEQPVAALGKLAEQLQASIERLSSLLTDLRDFSRQQRLELTSVNPVRLATTVKEQWQPVAAMQGIEVRLEVQGTPPFVLADEGKLLRVVDNLVKNAIEAIGQGPGEVALVISHRDDPQRPLRISVCDTGPGLPQSVDVFRLFETTKPTGSGLGLPIVRQLVEAHGGGISFAERKPHGTVFHIDLRQGPTG